MFGKNGRVRVLFGLLLAFSCYSVMVYTSGTEIEAEPMNRLETAGKSIWQKNNCISCHQLYGLGGYMGPDLTNVISGKGKGPAYVSAFVKTGIGAMPSYPLTEEEMEALNAYLAYVDKTGTSPVQNFRRTWYGSIQLE